MKRDYIVKLILKIILPVILLISGLVVFTSRIPGWSILIGLPMMVVSTVFIIYIYDELSQKLMDNEVKTLVKCSICGRLTPVREDIKQQDTVCSSCLIRMSKLFGRKSPSK